MKKIVALRLFEAREHDEIVLAINTFLELVLVYIEDKRRHLVGDCREKVLFGTEAIPSHPFAPALRELVTALQSCDELLIKKGFEKLGPNDYSLHNVDTWATNLYQDYLAQRRL